ncbi:hypothetical protein ILYODFUR_035779 [Ilyodon furcidens]|uniref:Uncharacterized protein n=1 Tax=Ilyodon furcidens TaxID=33524 RepID=A0ABV0U161_9TELE
MALWSKSSPASFCLSRYAPPMRRPVRQAGNGPKTLHLSRFMLPVTSELRMSKCATKMDDPNKQLKLQAVESESNQTPHDETADSRDLTDSESLVTMRPVFTQQAVKEVQNHNSWLKNI